MLAHVREQVARMQKTMYPSEPSLVADAELTQVLAHVLLFVQVGVGGTTRPLPFTLRRGG
jgi:hypothetical protein